MDICPSCDRLTVITDGKCAACKVGIAEGSQELPANPRTYGRVRLGWPTYCGWRAASFVPDADRIPPLTDYARTREDHR